MKQYYLKLTAGGLQSRGIIVACPRSHTGNLWQSCKEKQELPSPRHNIISETECFSPRLYLRFRRALACLTETVGTASRHTHAATWAALYKYYCVLPARMHLKVACCVFYDSLLCAVCPEKLLCNVAL